MAYIWNDYKIENQYKVADQHISPYMEVWDREGDIVPVNVFFRLYPLLFPDSFADGEERVNELMDKYKTSPRHAETANLLMRYIARLDRIKGMSLADIVMTRLYREIQQGLYGPWLKDTFETIECDKQRTILRYAAVYNLKEQRGSVYDAVIQQLFGTVRMYYEKSTGIVHIYIGQQRNRDNERLLQIADYLFKDIKIKTAVMWEGEHFGIIDTGQTMRLDQMALI